MIWTLVASAAVCGAFVWTYGRSGDVWSATHAAGLVALVNLIAILARFTRPPVSSRARLITVSVTGVLLLGVVSFWIVQWSMTSWQYTSLHLIRSEIEHSIMMDKVHERAIPVFASYCRQREGGKQTLAGIFRSVHPGWDAKSKLLDTLEDGIRLYAEVDADTEIILTGESGFTEGLSTTFDNTDGRKGLLQTRGRLTPEGVFCEKQN